MTFFSKILLNLFIFLMLSSCGFEVLDKSQLSNLKVESFRSQGSNQLNFIIKNKLEKSLNNQGNERVILTLKTEKNKSIKEKNSKNQVTKYQIEVKVSLIVN